MQADPETDFNELTGAWISTTLRIMFDLMTECKSDKSKLNKLSDNTSEQTTMSQVLDSMHLLKLNSTNISFVPNQDQEHSFSNTWFFSLQYSQNFTFARFLFSRRHETDRQDITLMELPPLEHLTTHNYADGTHTYVFTPEKALRQILLRWAQWLLPGQGAQAASPLHEIESRVDSLLRRLPGQRPPACEGC